MNDYTYKCASAKAAARRIWEADFYEGSFSDLVESKNPDSVVASVGLSEVSAADRRISLVATIHNHSWSQEVVELLIDEILFSEPPLLEWSVTYKNLSWTIFMAWRH